MAAVIPVVHPATGGLRCAAAAITGRVGCPLDALPGRGPPIRPGSAQVAFTGWWSSAGASAVCRRCRPLRNAAVEVTLVDRRNYHLFQPLLYQVATGALSPEEIAQPLRGILARQRNARVVLAEVTDIDLQGRRIRLRAQANGEPVDDLAYDSLIVAAGAAHSYFGNDERAPYAPGLKTVEDALEIRRRILTAFEAAELETCAERRQAWLTFAVIGAGPTGLELAGQIAEIARDTLRREFRTIDPSDAVILLVEATGRVLAAYDPKLSGKAAAALRHLGVTLMLNTTVADVTDGSIRRVAEGGSASEVRAGPSLGGGRLRLAPRRDAGAGIRRAA